MKGKKGISSLIAVVLILLLTIVLVGIIAVSYFQFSDYALRETAKAKCMDLAFLVSLCQCSNKITVEIDNRGKEIVSRDSLIMLMSEGNSISVPFPPSYNPSFSGQVFSVPLPEIGEIESAKIVPVIRKENQQVGLLCEGFAFEQIDECAEC